jgi:predicted NAD/FAD-dependent oxidoreductase
MAGLSCARVLRRAGFYVEVFEKDRIVGGRMATTRLGTAPFDHGAQYVTARSSLFRAYLDELEGGGYLARWMPQAAGADQGQLLPWFVGIPGMSSIVRPLAESVRLHTQRRVHTLQRTLQGWVIWFEDETCSGPFHAVAVTAPAAETQMLLGRLDALAQPLSRVRMAPCWTLLARLEESLPLAQDVFSDMSEIIRWIARNNTKPGRSMKGDHIVVHASPGWSRETEDLEADVVAQEMWNDVCRILGLPQVQPMQLEAVLWRHGLVDQSLGETFVFSRSDMVGMAGDWCLGRLAEHAFESGTGLGKAIVAAFD